MCRKNIIAIEFIFVSHKEVESHIVDYGLEKRYLMWLTVPGTRRFHCYKPCSKAFQMHRVSSDDVTILNRKPSIPRATVIMDDCEPGKYIACVYDKEWFLGIILMTSEEDQDVQVKLMMKSTQNHFHWPCRDDACWVPVNHVLCLNETVSIQSAEACGYCLSKRNLIS